MVYKYWDKNLILERFRILMFRLNPTFIYNRNRIRPFFFFKKQTFWATTLYRTGPVVIQLPDIRCFPSLYTIKLSTRNKVRHWETLKYDWFSINGVDRKWVLWIRSCFFYVLELAARLKTRIADSDPHVCWLYPDPEFEKNLWSGSAIYFGGSDTFRRCVIYFKFKVNTASLVSTRSRSRIGNFTFKNS